MKASIGILSAALLLAGCARPETKRYEDLSGDEHDKFIVCFNRTRAQQYKPTDTLEEKRKNWESAQLTCAKKQGIIPSTLLPAPPN